MEPQSKRPSAALAGTLLLTFGTLSSLTSKIQLLIPAQGYAGKRHYFEKPGFQTFILFCGCALSLPVGTLWGPHGPFKLRDFTLRQYVLPCLSSTSATIAVYLNTLGLIRVNLSIYQMLRGALTIFSTLFSILCLKKRFVAYQWIGIVLTITSLVIVGVAGVQMSGIDDRWQWQDRLLGVILIILAQVLQGGQLVYDEYMSHELGLPVMFIVGMEGVWGIVFEVLISQPLTAILPGSDPSPFGGSMEYFGDTFQMLANSWKISVITVATLFIIGCYDVAGMTVTSVLSSVHRTIFEALRTLTAWVAMLVIGIFSKQYGETWQSWSWLELGGFVLLVYSSLVFNKVLKLPCLSYPEENALQLPSVS